MKINLPLDVINDCLLHSLKFRNYVAELVSEDIDESNEQSIRMAINMIVNSNPLNTIQVVKDLRAYSLNTVENILRAYDGLIDFGDCTEYYSKQQTCLFLADSKKIVDYVRS